ncbi:MAG: DUF1580 domain-containing protein [Gemmataceae bacterium]|nr:DUF1580 domain-containing protein [Gemmataceae bacterium]
MVIVENDLITDIATGNGISLVELAHRHRANPSTVFRWVQKGLPRGDGTRVKLQALRRGKKWLTTAAAVERFFAALPASAPIPTAPPVPIPSKRGSVRAKQAPQEQYGI